MRAVTWSPPALFSFLHLDGGFGAVRLLVRALETRGDGQPDEGDQQGGDDRHAARARGARILV